MKKLIGSFILVLGLCVASAAFAGQLFPPANVVAGTKECPAGRTLLQWNGATGTVDCVSLADVLDMKCPTGKIFQGFNDAGVKICGTATAGAIPASDCGDNKYPEWNGSRWICHPITIPSSEPEKPCRVAYQIKQWDGRKWICTDPPSGTYAGGWDRDGKHIEPVYGVPARCRPGWTLVQMEDAKDAFTVRQWGFMCRKN